MRVGHAKSRADGNGGLNGVATLFQDFKASLRGQFVRACDNALRGLGKRRRIGERTYRGRHRRRNGRKRRRDKKLSSREGSIRDMVHW